MNKFFTTIKNIFSIKELRDRILLTLSMLVAFRVGSHVVLPAVDFETLQANMQSNALGDFLDMFLGGAWSNASIFGLGIMPYITASIVFQLAGVALPAVQRMQKEGESGRKKLNQYTRMATVVICLGQSVGYVTTMVPAEAVLIDYQVFKFIVAPIVLASGTIFCMWLGEKITDRGIGNGISMLIMIGIISRFPASIMGEVTTQNNLLLLLGEFLGLFGVIMFTVWLTQGVRKIPVQYARQVVGNSRATGGGKREYIPIKVNTAGVMPIIFAQSLMFLPGVLVQSFPDNDAIRGLATPLSDFTSWQYNILFGGMIILFTYFYTAITINPDQIAEDMKRNNGFIPGVKPGEPTSNFIGNVVDLITLPSSVFLALIAVMPAVAAAAGVGRELSYFFGGTSLLIMVQVLLDTLQQIESYLLNKHYAGMMESGGKVRRRQRVAVAS